MVKKEKVKEPVWITVDVYQELSSSHDSFSLSYLKKWVKENVPEDISDEDIVFDFESEIEPTYYDDYLINSKLTLRYKKKDD